MASARSVKGMQFDMSFGGGRGSEGTSTPSTFRILVMGEFSTRTNRGVCESLADRRALRVDCDNLEARLAAADTALTLDLAEGAIAWEFGELEDFHPERIYDGVTCFADLRRLRKRLSDPSTFAEAAAEVRAWAEPADAGTGDDALPAPGSSCEAPPASQAPQDTDDFQSLLGRPAAGGRGPSAMGAVSSAVEDIIRQAVAPHVVPTPAPDKDELVSAVDAATARLMRRFLAHADFRRLERVWRGLDFLTRNLETGEALELFMLDVSKEELRADGSGADETGETPLTRLLATGPVETPGGQPWSLVLGLFSFERTGADAALLERLGTIGTRAGAPLIAHIACDDVERSPDPAWAETWRGLRGGGAGDYLCLATPGFMLRLPYGPDTDPVDRFDFSELSEPPDLSDYLWGNPAVVCGVMIGRAFLQKGAAMDVNDIRALDGLPMHVYKVDGDSRMTPCARYWLSDVDADRLMEEGLTPVMSVKGRDAVQVPAFVTVSGRPVPVRGRLES